MSRVCVIIPAAGGGKRFGGQANKIFMPLAGRPVVIRTLELFAGRSDVCQIVMAAAAGDMEEIRRRFADELKAVGVQIVRGGAARSRSVRNALSLVSDEADLVCVHDAVRPCVAPSWIDAVFAKAAETGAAILACPVRDTVKKVSAANVIEETVDRSGLWEAQTPQVFRADVIRAAYASQEDATDDAHLVQAAGYQVSIVTGDPRNIKITTPEDLCVAEGIIKSLLG